MGYKPELLSIIGRHQNEFPNEEKLKRMISKYSVTHIIFHWDLIAKFQNQPRRKMQERVNQIINYGKIIYSDEKHTVMKTKEYIPIKRIIRTYSQYHLRKKQVKVVLSEKYSGNITIFLNNRLVRRQKIDSEFVSIDLREWPLSISGNRIEIVFKQPVMLNSIELI
jgi:hypothetical protein